ncbi:MAG: cytochrome c1 [Pseudomonadota bacterium]
MRILRTIALSAVAAVGLTAAGPALAAGEGVGVIDRDWSFEGPLGTFDQAELQRGWQVYMQVCSSCHAMHQVSFRNLGDPSGPGYSEEQVKAMAENFLMPVREVVNGELVDRTPTANDKIVGPYSIVTASGSIAYDEASWSDANKPPDLSVMTKARVGYTGIINQIVSGSGGPEYVYSLLMGYQDVPPEGFEPQGVLSYNRYYPGHQIAMAQPLYEGSVEYQDGAEATVEQMSHDVTAFLAWAAEPTMVERKQAGVRNLIFLAIFGVLVWYSNKKLWKPIKDGGDAA